MAHYFDPEFYLSPQHSWKPESVLERRDHESLNIPTVTHSNRVQPAVFHLEQLLLIFVNIPVVGCEGILTVLLHSLAIEGEDEQ